jgi:hypothetical protein
MRTALVILGLVTLLAAPALAEAPEQGESEVSFAVSYSDIDRGAGNLGSFENVDFGSTTSTDLTLAYGWYITDMHEVGGILRYTKIEDEFVDVLDGDLVQIKTDADGVEYGGFYHFNFNYDATTTPFVGIEVVGFAGDVSDAYDYGYAGIVGLKVYPFDHAGVVFSGSYFERTGADDLPDADGFELSAGLLIKY